MSQEIFYDRNNKSFVIVDKTFGKMSKLLRIIHQEQFDDQLKLAQLIRESVDFINDPKNNILPDYMLNLKIAPRRLQL